MAVPTYAMRQLLNNTPVASLDTAAERLAVITGDEAVNMGSPPAADAPLDFGTVDISGGNTYTDVATAIWHISADGGNTSAEAFKLWFLAADRGFDDAASLAFFETLSGADNAAPSLTENYIVSAVYTSYTGNAMPTTEPAQNLYPSDEGTSMVLSTASDDALLWAQWFIIDGDETTGTYEAADAGYELRFSFEFAYS